jgi:hypothetical protein
MAANMSPPPPIQPGPGARKQALVYGLTRRGFCSEINVLVCNVAYAMAAGEDPYLDDQGFFVPWRQLLQPTLPMAADLREELYERVAISHPKIDRAAWDHRLWSVKRACDEGLEVEIPELGFQGGWAALLALLSKRLFVPREETAAAAALARTELGLDQPFCAVHIRRGDKTAGYRQKDGVVRIEGGVVPFQAYTEKLASLSPGVRRVFVLSDDHREVVAARELHPELELVTLCDPGEEGYRHGAFLALRHMEQLHALRRLIVEVLIAQHSAAFVGLYRSNVSLLIAALHSHPETCASVDRAKAWTPMT